MMLHKSRVTSCVPRLMPMLRTHLTIALDFTDIVRTDDTDSVQFVTQLSELFH